MIVLITHIIEGQKGKQSISNFDIVSLSNGVSSLTRVRLFSPILQHKKTSSLTIVRQITSFS